MKLQKNMQLCKFFYHKPINVPWHKKELGGPWTKYAGGQSPFLLYPHLPFCLSTFCLKFSCLCRHACRCMDIILCIQWILCLHNQPHKPKGSHKYYRSFSKDGSNSWQLKRIRMPSIIRMCNICI